MFDVVRGLHILAAIAWMAGLLYLPRLFVYHTRSQPGSETEATLAVMEARLLRGIMNPALIGITVLSLWLVWLDGSLRLGWSYLLTPWMLVKLGGGLLLVGWHHYLAIARKRLANGERRHSERFWRVTNEAPFLVAAAVVLAATTKFGA